MFPKCSLSEARSALSIAKGDMEEAVRLIIEGDVQLSPSPLNVSPYCSQTCCLINFVLLVWAVGFHDVFLCSGKPREEHFLSGRPETEGEHPWEVRLLWSHCEQKWLYFSNRHNFVSSAGTCWSTTRTITKRIAPLHQKMWVPVWPLPQLFSLSLLFNHFLLFLRLQRSSLDTTAIRWWPPKGSAISLWRRTRRRRWRRRTSTWNPRGSTAFIDEEHKHGRAAFVGIVYTKGYLSSFTLKLAVFVPRERFVSV